MNEFNDLPSITPGTYEHYKGKRYLVHGVGAHTETREYFVAYSPLYDHPGQPSLWLRPYAMFIEPVEIDGKSVPRFKKIDAE
jgi:hypothetical protein